MSKIQRVALPNQRLKTGRCFFGDNRGRVRLDAQAGAQNAQVGPKDNAADSGYYSALYNSGATPNSFFKDKRRYFQPKTGVVRTAGAVQGGVGTASFGQLRLRCVVHVPLFKHNLVSGIQIMKMGVKQIIQHDKLTILDNGKLVANGTTTQRLVSSSMLHHVASSVVEISAVADYSEGHPQGLIGVSEIMEKIDKLSA